MNAATEKFLGFAGKVLVNTDAIDKLLGLRSIYHIIRYIGEFEIDNLEDIYSNIKEMDIDVADAKSFRITSNRIGNPRKAVSFRRLALNANFYLEHERVVENGDIYPHIFVLRL